MSRIRTLEVIAAILYVLTVAGCNTESVSTESARDCQVQCKDCGELILDCGAQGSGRTYDTKVPQ